MKAQLRHVVFSFVRRAASLVLISLIGACGSGGGGVDSTDPTIGDTTPPAIDGFTFSLAEGSHWDFYWVYNGSTTTTSGTSQSVDAGNFRVSLGAPSVMSGITAFPVTVTGDHTDYKNFDYAPRWQYLALQASRLLGSTDGATFITVFDAATGSWSGGGFFAPFPDDVTVTAIAATATNDFIDTSAMKVSRSSSQSQCSYFPEAGTVCGDDPSYTLSESEYHKGGIGPVAYHYHYSYADPSGTLYTSSNRDLGLVATTFVATDGFQPTGPAWVQKAPMPTERAKHCATAVDNDIYVMGGTGGVSVDIYSTVDDSWSAGTPLPAERLQPACTTIGGKIYLMGGTDNSGTETASVFEFDPATGSWATLADLSIARSEHGVVEVDGAALVIGGGSKTSVEFFYPGSAPLSGASLPTAMSNSATAASGVGNDRRVYVFGIYCPGCLVNKYLSTCNKLDPYTWTWTSCGFLPGGRAFHSAATIGSTIYAIGGANSLGSLNTLAAYDPGSDTWTTKAPMLHPRSFSAAAVANGRLYVFGGWGSTGVSTTVEEYDPGRDP